MDTLFQTPPPAVSPTRRNRRPAHRPVTRPAARHAADDGLRVVALSLEPFPLWLAQRRTPELRRTPLAAARERRVEHANPAARQLGISRGMRLDGARLRAPHLVVTEPSEPELAQAWDEVLRELGGWSPWLDGRRRGLALLRLTPHEAEALVEALGGRGGMAGDRRTAELAAATARPGEVRKVAAGETSAFLARMPLRFLRSVGLAEGDLTRLHWLGLVTVGDLARWSAAQLRAYLGDAGQRLLPYLHGPRETALPTWSAPSVLRRQLAFDRPLSEPGEIEAAVGHLAEALAHALAGRGARRLTVVADIGSSVRPATRLAKRPLTRSGQIRRQALLALHDSGALAGGIEALTLELSGSERCAEQEGLWVTRAQRERAQDAVSERFPSALLQVRWGDPHAPAVDQAWSWEPLDEAVDRSLSEGVLDEAVPLFAVEPSRPPLALPRRHPPLPSPTRLRPSPVARPVDLTAVDVERFERPPGDRSRSNGRILRAA
jgi:protein ImuB